MHQLRWANGWNQNPKGSSRPGSNPARSEIFLCLREPALERKPRVKWFHWNDEVEHSALNLIPPAAMAEWLRRWTRNPIGSSRGGSNLARTEIYFVLKKEIQLWKGSHASSGSHWNDEVEHSALNLCDGRVVKALDSKFNGIFARRFDSC